MKSVCTISCAIMVLLSNSFSPVPDHPRPAASKTRITPALPDRQPLAPIQKAAAIEASARLPLYFEANLGQTDSRVKFVSRSGGNALLLTSTDAYWRYGTGQGGGSVLRMNLVGANPAATVRGLEPQPGRSNYFSGKDPRKWRTNVPHYAKVEYRDTYPGVDLVYHGTQRQLEYDFVVSAGADPGRIALQFEGAQRIEIDPNGDLVLHTAAGVLRQKKPDVYQQIGTEKREVDGRYALDYGQRVHFELGEYDPSFALVIDPLVYSTYLAGSVREDGEGMTVDSAGNLYVTGATASGDFPTTPGAFGRSLGNPVGVGDEAEEDAFIVKLNPTGTALIYATYLGGSGNDQGNAVVVDAAGNAYIAGSSDSNDFPVTAGAYQANPGGLDADGLVLSSGFVAKLNATGSTLLYSTFVHLVVNGRSFATPLVGLGVRSGVAYVAGSSAQPLATGDINDGYVAAVNTTGTGLVWAYPFGGKGDDEVESLYVDAAGNIFVAGETASTDFPVTAGAYQTTFGGGPLDGFLLKLSAAGTPVFATYLGGSGEDGCEDVALDAAGNIYVMGNTNGHFPAMAGAYRAVAQGGFDIYAMKLNAAGSAALYATYIGGSKDDHGDAIAVDAAGNMYITGSTLSSDFPATADALQNAFRGGNTEGDAFFTKLNAAGSALVYSTYIGGSGDDYADAIAMDAAGNVYITGATSSGNFPITNGAFQTNCSGCNNVAYHGFVLKIDPLAGVPASITVVSGANQSGVQGARLTLPLVVKVVDARNAAVAGAPVTFTATNATTSPATVSTDSSGNASTQVTLGSAMGSASVTATVGGASATFSFTVGSAGPQVTVTSVVNGASFLPGIQDGSWTSILGTNLSATTRTWNAQTEIVNGVLPPSLDGVSVTIDGKPAAVYYISPTQLNVQAPITGKTGAVTVAVTNSIGSVSATANVMKYSPGLFLFDPQGRKYPAALIARSDGGVDYLGPANLFGSALPTRPAKPGEIVELFGTGFGPTNPPVPAGVVYSGGAPVDPPGAVTATIGGVNAPVLFAGITGAGLYQINLTVPDVGTGDQKVILTVSGLQTQDNIFVSVLKP